MSDTARSPIAGRRILVTRPTHQAVKLCSGLRARGAEPVLFPALDIVALEEAGQARATLRRLADFALVIFSSANAVEHAVHLLEGAFSTAATRVAAVGPGTAQALAHWGAENVLIPSSTFDTEGLLELPELADSRGAQILIVKGRGGRVELERSLRERGAQVTSIDVYERRPPAADPGPLLSRWSTEGIDAVVVTSSEGLRFFHDAIGASGQRLLAATPLVVPHPRIALAARSLGLARVAVSGPGDDAMIHELECFFDRVNG